jgi:dihydroflavonol-4-reductase
MAVFLITGSTGFIGSHLCSDLVARGHDVKAFHRPSSRLQLLENLPIEHVIGDITRPETLTDRLKGVDFVIHAAATSGGVEKPGQMYTVIVEGTKNILKAALQAGVKRVVHVSSAAVLGIPEQLNSMEEETGSLDEFHSWNSTPRVWPFGYNKYLAELEVQKMVGQGLDVVMVNPTLVMGAGDLGRQTSSILVQTAHKRIPFITSGGVNVIHIDDVVQGIMAAVEFGKRGERYILGNKNLPYSSFIRLCSEVTGVDYPDFTLNPGMLRRLSRFLPIFQAYISSPIPLTYFALAGKYFYYQNQKAREQLGWEPRKEILQTLTEAYEWFKMQGTIR